MRNWRRAAFCRWGLWLWRLQLRHFPSRQALPPALALMPPSRPAPLLPPRAMPAGSVPVRVTAVLFVDVADCTPKLVEGAKSAVIGFLASQSGVLEPSIVVILSCTPLVRRARWRAAGDQQQAARRRRLQTCSERPAFVAQQAR
jgi:hypothetical protein